MLSNLRHRVKQQGKRGISHDEIQCRMNSSTLTWSNALGLIQDNENAGKSVAGTCEFLQVGQMLEHLSIELAADIADISARLRPGSM